MLNKLYLLSFLVLTLLLSSHSCEKKKQTENQITTETNMSDNTIKTTFKFDDNYDSSWKKVDSLDQKGLYRSALDLVNEIYAKAEKENQTPDFIKALIYRLKYASQLEEDDFKNSIAALSNLAETQKYPVKQLVHSITAEFYWKYYENNRYNILQRSTTIEYKNDDVETWNFDQITKQIQKHYLLSLSESNLLQKTALSDFKKILMMEKGIELRPTLYDFLVFRAIDFFQNDEMSLNKSANRFNSNQSEFLGSVNEFISAKVPFDSLSNIALAINLYQDVLRFHSTDKTPEVFVDMDLNRFQFVLNNSTLENKNELYYSSLNSLSEKYKGQVASAMVDYKRAVYLMSLASTYLKENPEHQFKNKEALEVCERVSKDFLSTVGGTNCLGLISQIKQKELHFTLEKAYEPNQNSKINLTFKNLDEVYLRIVRIKNPTKFQQEIYNLSDIQKLEKILSFPKENEWTEKVPNRGDYLKHSTELSIPKLNYGAYYLIVSSKKDFQFDEVKTCFQLLQISDISTVSSVNKDGSLTVKVLHRQTGKPLKNVEVIGSKRTYNYPEREYVWSNSQTFKTDENGEFKMPVKNDSYSMDYFLGEDALIGGDNFYTSKPWNGEERTNYETRFFIDRGIYRPGQTVYFKGVMLKGKNNKYEIVTNKKTKVKLFDANYQQVKVLDVVSNEFGTFSGSFVLPSSGLTGQFHIEDANGSEYFSVEEYKRPKFEVSMDPVKGSYKLGQEVHVTGKAKSYAGAAIDNAKVVYRITRSSYFSPWCYWRWGFYPTNQQTIEIKQGELKTDELGNIDLRFIASPDATINAKYRPYFSYQVSIDITDVSGETQSTSESVTVGYEALKLDVSIPKTVFSNKSDGKFGYSTTNLNGEAITAKGKITITELIQPKEVLRPRLLSAPDLPKYSQEEFKKLFPSDEVSNELNEAKFEKGKVVYSVNVDSEKDKTFAIENIQGWKQGYYEVEMTALDTFGVEVKTVERFTVINSLKTENALTKIWYSYSLKSICEPGETAEFLIGSAVENAEVYYELELKGVILKKEKIVLSKNQRIVSIPIKEEYRGNVSVHFYLVNKGRYFEDNYTIVVPYSNKELTVSFETFRDKLLPGQNETWKLNISGPKKEKVVAELLISMYDASLDAFRSNDYSMSLYSSNYSNRNWSTQNFTTVSAEDYSKNWNQDFDFREISYPSLNWYGYSFMEFRNRYFYNFGALSNSASIYGADSMVFDAVITEEDESGGQQQFRGGGKGVGMAKASKRMIPYEGLAEGDVPGKDGKFTESEKQEPIKVRTNFSETAFFYPQLRTDKNGNVVVNFTVPEALTRWKVLGLAHTKDLKVGTTQNSLVTQKDLMIQANAPRFVREGDKFYFAAKITNLSEENVNGVSELLLFDAATMQPVDVKFKHTTTKQNFTIEKGQSTAVFWELDVPEGISALKYRVTAKTQKHSDGEEMVLPILSNRELVTEALPLPSRGIGTKSWTFDKLIASKGNTSLKHHKLTLEYTSNPAWYAVQSLPYLMEYPHECAEQTFSRFYANALASQIIQSNPKIKQIFEQWKTSSPESFLSNLEKNQDLKNIVLEETPWVLESQDQSERKKRVALLFDLNKMDNQLERAIDKLAKMQLPSGAWPWFSGMYENRYITQHIVTGIGHLRNLEVKQASENKQLDRLLKQAIAYLDFKLNDDYIELKKYNTKFDDEIYVSETQIEYLYARAYFKELEINPEHKEAFDFYTKQAEKMWLRFPIQTQAMIAFQANRNGRSEVAKEILASLKERSIDNEEMGVYWKENVSGFGWYEAPIENQALLIEAFDEITNDQKMVEGMKVWLLKNKQTNDWKTTKATADACYALLLRGVDLLVAESTVEIKMNNQVIDPKQLGLAQEAGTGYFKTSWTGTDIKPEMGNISVTRKTEGVSWGAVYWQYFEDLDKITSAETPLKLKKELFIVKNTDNGPVITPISETTELKVGDKVRVRIVLKSDRDMEFVHMKDLRAAGFEPINVISSYKWQEGLGYYESTKDVATHFFFDFLPKGTFVFEYDLRVSLNGQFSNGITSIESMYAPEFRSHSNGMNVKIVK